MIRVGGKVSLLLLLLLLLLLVTPALAQSSPKHPSSKGAKPLAKTKLDWSPLKDQGPVTYVCIGGDGKIRSERLEQRTSFKKDEVKFVDEFSGFGATVATQTSYAKVKTLRLRKVVYTEKSGDSKLKRIEFLAKHKGDRVDRMIFVWDGKAIKPPTRGFAAWKPGVVSGYGLQRVARLLPREAGKTWTVAWTHEFGDANAVSGYLIECVGPKTVKVSKAKLECTLFRFWSRKQATTDGTTRLNRKLQLRAELYVGDSGYVERMRFRAPHGYWNHWFVRRGKR